MLNIEFESVYLISVGLGLILWYMGLIIFWVGLCVCIYVCYCLFVIVSSHSYYIEQS